MLFYVLVLYEIRKAKLPSHSAPLTPIESGQLSSVLLQFVSCFYYLISGPVKIMASVAEAVMCKARTFSGTIASERTVNQCISFRSFFFFNTKIEINFKKL